MPSTDCPVHRAGKPRRMHISPSARRDPSNVDHGVFIPAKFVTDRAGDYVPHNHLALEVRPSEVFTIRNIAQQHAIPTDRTQFEMTFDGSDAFHNKAGNGLFLPEGHLPLLRNDHLLAFDGHMVTFPSRREAEEYMEALEKQGDDGRYILFADLEVEPEPVVNANRKRRCTSHKAVCVVGVFTDDKATMANDPTFGIQRETTLWALSMSRVNAVINYEPIIGEAVTLPWGTGGEIITLANRPCWSLVAKGDIICSKSQELFVEYGSRFSSGRKNSG